jgi:uncharacterized spore protein YtfJ
VTGMKSRWMSMAPLSAEDSPGHLVDRLARAIGGRTGATSVFGAPVERDDVTVIPVAGVRFGFGGGSGHGPDGQGDGGGGGGGGASRPLGFIEIRQGRARFRRITDPIAFGLAWLMVAAAATILARATRRLRAGCRTYARRRAEADPQYTRPLDSEVTAAEASGGQVRTG